MVDLLGCQEIVVINPPNISFNVTVPHSLVHTSAPELEIVVKNPNSLSVVTETPDSINIVLPVGGPPGPSSFRYTYLDPVQLPDGARTVFTVPTAYVVGTLAVFLNGLQEHYITQLTTTTFSFETAPILGDTIKIDFNTLS